VLTENCTGNFPLWLAPVQIKVLSFTDRNIKYAQKVIEQLNEAGLRVEENFNPDTVQYKVREAEMQKIPYIITIGDKEQKNNTLAVRDKNGKVKFGVKINTFIKELNKEIEKKS
jgi:threonyl-tRNA synthetase